MNEQNKPASISIHDISSVLNMLSVAIDRNAFVGNELNLARVLRDKMNQFVSAALAEMARQQTQTNDGENQEVAHNSVEEIVSEEKPKNTKTNKKDKE